MANEEQALTEVARKADPNFRTEIAETPQARRSLTVEEAHEKRLAKRDEAADQETEEPEAQDDQPAAQDDQPAASGVEWTEAEVTARDQIRDAVGRHENARQRLENWAASVDWQNLSREQYQTNQKDLKDAQQQVQQFGQQIQEEAHRLHRHRQQRLMRGEAQELAERLPDADANTVTQYLRDKNFTEEEVQGVGSKAKFVELAEKARRYDEGQNAKLAPSRKTAKVRKGKKTASKNTAADDARKKLKRTGSLDDAFAALKAE